MIRLLTGATRLIGQDAGQFRIDLWPKQHRMERNFRFIHRCDDLRQIAGRQQIRRTQAIADIQQVDPLSTTQFRILHAADANPSAALLALAAQHGWQAEQLVPLRTRLEDVFMQITQDEKL